MTKKQDFNFGQEVTIFNVDDIKRMRSIFGLTQQNLADDLGKNKSYIGQIESGKKNLSDNFKETLSDYFTEQSKIRFKSIEEMKRDNDKRRDAYIDSLSKYEERKAHALRMIAKRKAKSFQPSVVPSIDMIWLQTVLDSHKDRIFRENFIYSSDPCIQEMVHKYPDQIERDCEYLIPIECEDVHITVKYGFKTKDSGGKITNKLVVQFNPNKADFKNNKYLHLLFYLLGDNPKCRKFDVCKDYVCVPMSTVLVSETQRRGIYQYITKGEGVTHYLGDINNNGIRVYDKRAEIKAKDSVVINGEKHINDIGYECTRYEHRRTMPKATGIKDIPTSLEGINLPVLSSYDCLNLLTCSDEELQKGKIDFMVYSSALMVLEGRMPITHLKACNRTQYIKVMDYLKKIKLENLCLSDSDIIQAVDLFCGEYSEAYEIGFNNFHNILVQKAKERVHISDESIDKATQMLCDIVEGKTEKLEIIPMTKEEKKAQIRKTGEKLKDKNKTYRQATIDDISNDDTKYF